MRENSKWKFEADDDDDDAMTWYHSPSYSAAASAAATDADDDTINVGSSSRVFVMLCPALFTGNVVQCPRPLEKYAWPFPANLCSRTKIVMVVVAPQLGKFHARHLCSFNAVDNGK